jgi:hypothetical protein
MLPTDNTIRSLSNQLQQLLAEDLGTIDVGGHQVPGVWVEPPIMPTEATPDGLIVIISDIPEQATAKMQQWRVNLVQWRKDAIGSAQLANAVEKMRWKYPSNRRERFLPVTVDAPLQVTFLLGFNEVGYSTRYSP